MFIKVSLKLFIRTTDIIKLYILEGMQRAKFRRMFNAKYFKQFWMKLENRTRRRLYMNYQVTPQNNWKATSHKSYPGWKPGVLNIRLLHYTNDPETIPLSCCITLCKYMYIRHRSCILFILLKSNILK